MNVLFLSPAFPPHHHLFCAALRRRGVTVLGVGDTPHHELPPGLAAALTEYVWLPSLEDHETLHRAVAGLIHRHGRIDRLDSLIEHWLGHEGQLRDDFNVPGLRADATARMRRKSGMAELYAAAGVPQPPGRRVEVPGDVRDFARTHGLPLVVKPDTSAGAVGAFRVDDEERLRDLPELLPGRYVQPFVTGDIVTFDGLTDRDGAIVFSTSHTYDAGIMEVVGERRDGHYYSQRVIPADLDDLGRRAVAAFDLRERFFHAEFFRRPDGSLLALEMNLRPPGGFTVDMMNYACDLDLYDLWAAVLTGAPTAGRFGGERPFHSAHAGRRDGRSYRLSHDALLATLGDTLVLWRRLPAEFAAMQGNVMYLLRHPDLATLREAIALVQAV